jgi:hypothetical protein
VYCGLSSEWNHRNNLMTLVGHLDCTIVWVTALLNDTCTECGGNPQSHIACCSEVWQIG